jgi:DNA replication protein DnaC
MNTAQALYDKLSALRLPAFVGFLKDLDEHEPDQAARILPPLDKMASEELAARSERSVKRAIAAAQFVQIQTVDAFDFEYNASMRKLKKNYLRLLNADLPEQGLGAIFVGGSGLGKTHLARALGYAACQNGRRVLFRTCSAILNDLVTAQATKDLNREIHKLVSPALLIIDELAYLSMSHEEADLFFQIISRRHDRHRPTVVTTNKPFAEWNQVFHGDAIAHAIVDRLTERSEIFYVEGKSYRQTHRQGLK